MKPLLVFLLFTGLVCACSTEDSRKQCEKDGDCNTHWRCDMYTYTCRCISDDGCNAAASERCMPDGTCQVYTGCSSDMDCPSQQRCDVPTGECLCISNEACPEGEICNPSGYCQPSEGCYDNVDCAAGEYCAFDDGFEYGSCQPEGSCTHKFQCPIAQICEAGSCVDGCEDYGDCPYKWACSNGQCVQGLCDDDSFCEFMEYCQGGNCLDAYDPAAPYCKPCDGQNLTDCGSRANPCLIYPFDPPEPFAAVSDEYCSVDCSGGGRCPKGFECSSIITVSQTDLCRSDNECPNGLPCLLNPEEDQGFCPCHPSLNPCMSNSCLPGMCLMNTCLGVSTPCTTDADCSMCTVTRDACTTSADCRAVECELYDGVDYGGCVSARACGLADGYHCPPP